MLLNDTPRTEEWEGDGVTGHEGGRPVRPPEVPADSRSAVPAPVLIPLCGRGRHDARCRHGEDGVPVDADGNLRDGREGTTMVWPLGGTLSQSPWVTRGRSDSPTPSPESRQRRLSETCPVTGKTQSQRGRHFTRISLRT